jgi:hypothetical protein
MRSAVHPLAASLALAALAAIAVSACSAPPGGGTQVDDAPQTAKRVTIDTGAIAALPAGQSYIVDIGRADTTYSFDYTAAPIDFSRVTIRFASGHDVPMTDWLARTATGGKDLVARNPTRFELRPTQSDALTQQHAVIPVEPPECVTLCMWVCESEIGPCDYECITNCP